MAGEARESVQQDAKIGIAGGTGTRRERLPISSVAGRPAEAQAILPGPLVIFVDFYPCSTSLCVGVEELPEGPPWPAWSPVLAVATRRAMRKCGRHLPIQRDRADSTCLAVIRPGSAATPEGKRPPG